MDGGQAWKVIPGIPIHDNKKENAALNDVQVEVNYAINLMINGRCAREC